MKKTYAEGLKPGVMPFDVHVFAYINGYFGIHGFAPTYREITHDLKAYPDRLNRAINRLVYAGVLKRTTAGARNLSIQSSPFTDLLHN